MNVCVGEECICVCVCGGGGVCVCVCVVGGGGGGGVGGRMIINGMSAATPEQLSVKCSICNSWSVSFNLWPRWWVTSPRED